MPELSRFYKVVSFKIVGHYTLHVHFDDQTSRVIDFEPVLGGEAYRPLRDLSLFNRVRLDPEVHTLIWPNGADFDPATLHDWDQHAAELAQRAKQWELASVR